MVGAWAWAREPSLRGDRGHGWRPPPAGGEGLVGLGQPAPCLAGAALARTPARPAGACLSRQWRRAATRLVRPGSSGAEAALELWAAIQ